jgi:hypothetical protein
MQRGFGLISLLISLLIVAALTGVVLQVYFQATMAPLTRDLSGDSVRPDQGARLAEAQILLTRTMVALTSCAQAKGVAGRSCSLEDVAGYAGVGPTGLSADGRWQIIVAHLNTGAEGTGPVGQVSIAGVDGNAKGLSVSLFVTPGGTVTRCDASGGPPPASQTSGQGC